MEDKEKGHLKINERRSNHIIVESKYINYNKRQFRIEQEPLQSKIRNLPKYTGRYSTINNNKRDNNTYINNIPNEKLTEKDINKNKENNNYYSTKLTKNNSKLIYIRRNKELNFEKEKP